MESRRSITRLNSSKHRQQTNKKIVSLFGTAQASNNSLIVRQAQQRQQQDAIQENLSTTKKDDAILSTSTTITSTTTATITTTKQSYKTCAACNKQIKRDKYLLRACDKYWHENCLKCDRCRSRLGELGSTLYTKANMILCKSDFMDMFGQTGVCSLCSKMIAASELVMRARQNVYHLECFACQVCNQRFCVGDRFYLFENKIVCHYDYEENQMHKSKTVTSMQSQPIQINEDMNAGQQNLTYLNSNIALVASENEERISNLMEQTEVFNDKIECSHNGKGYMLDQFESLCQYEGKGDCQIEEIGRIEDDKDVKSTNFVMPNSQSV